ncbi:MAG: conjugal transfer protein TraF [Bacteroidota bacterium]|nr:conjugal transfer protein TraF [Bacteroidota bacterium]
MQLVKRIILTVSLIGPYSIMAQNIDDVNRFSSPMYLGTPRYMATGGAFGALGNDFSAVAINPAGIAVFRHTQLSGSFGWRNQFTESNYLGFSENDPINPGSVAENKQNMVLNNLGFVKKFTSADETWDYSLGITFNQNNNFNLRSTISGNNPYSSIIDEWIFYANGFSPNQLESNGLYAEKLAYDHYLINPDANNQYSTPATGIPVSQYVTIDQNGSKNEFGISGGASLMDRLYLGGSLNIQFVNFRRKTSHNESGFTGDSIRSFTYNRTDNIFGTGVNLRFGAIYRLTRDLRVGLALESPTWYSFEQTTTLEMQTRFINGSETEPSSIETYPYVWRMSSAPRMTASAAYVFGKTGFLSVDYDLMAYPWQKTGAPDFSMEYLNRDIDDLLAFGHNLRVGAEIRAGKFAFRGGGGFATSPFSSSVRSNMLKDPGLMTHYGLGIGFHDLHWGVDLAYAIQNASQDYYLYSPSLGAGANLNETRSLFNVGFYFRLK